MGLKQLVTYIADVRAAIARPNAASTSVAEWVNWSINELATGIKFSDLELITGFNPTAGVEQYPYPIGMRAIHEEGVFIRDPVEKRRRLIPETMSERLKHVTYESTSWGTPTNFTLFGKSIFLRPLPDDPAIDLKVFGWSEVAPLVGDADVSPLPNDWDEIVFLGAVFRGFRAYTEQERAINIKNEQLALVRSKMELEGLEPFPEGGISMVQSADDYSRL